ncbi:uncharacterized protein LOC117650951 isoform X2 [Thrips palmi]|nr:uncharacterized protein LOC117650951 isoform X2 [Thrips palmi]
MMSAVPSDISSGKFTATFPTRIYEKPYRPFRYWVLGTDYVSFAVMFSCQEPEGLDRGLHRPDLDRFAGPWWNVQHGPYAEDSDRQSCRVTEIAATGRNTIKLVNSVMIKKDAFKPGNEHAWQTSESQWRGSDRRDGSFGNDLGAKMCVLATDYDNWAVLSVCAARDEGDGFPVLPFGARWVVKPGGVYVLARNRGLTPEQQAHANKAVAKAGIPPSYMQATPSTPCPEVLLPATAGAANKTPAILLLFGLATVLGPAQ